MTKLRLTLAATAVLLIASSAATPLLAQSVEDNIKRVAQRLETARSGQLDLVSPKHFSEAAKKLKEAQSRYSRGGKIDEIQRLLASASSELSKAEGFDEVGKVLLRDAIKARSDAAEANAPEFATKEWDEAEEMMREAGERVERGDQNGTRQRASRAEQMYRSAELRAIRADVLGKARDARAAAVKAEAQKWASGTFANAGTLLGQAEAELNTDRYDRSRARELAAQATSQFKRSARIAAAAKRIDDDARTRVEALILDHETGINRVAQTLNRNPDFAEGSDPITDEIVQAIESLYDDRANLEEELARKNREIERLHDVEIRRLRNLADSLDTRLALLEQRERAVIEELREREEQEEKVRRVKSTFDATEAEVLISGDEMILRLYGITFPVGSAEIRPANFGLLTKVQRVLREFPTSPVIVGGHTDSRGNDATNRALSQRRADAVREYLLANMSIDEERISAVGYGESQPIASNETEAGRAKNRRIDILLSMSGEPLDGMP